MDVIILTLDAVMAVVNLLRLNFFFVCGGHFSIYFLFLPTKTPRAYVH